MKSATPSDSGPIQLLSRRLRWRAHWALRPGRPLVLERWWDGMTIVLPKSGSAATIYYRTFPSPAIADWMSGLLAPGMTVVDVGAHAGVYSMLAARLVGPEGTVHAVEPQPGCAALIGRSAELNSLTNLRTHALALGDEDGEIELVVDPRTLGGFTGSVQDGEAMAVPSRTLATFAASERLPRIDLLKLDAAGNEPAVLRGAGALLDGAVGTVICKLYHPDVVAERFGAAAAGPDEVVEILRRHGFDVELPGGRPAGAAELRRLFADGEYTIPALARRA